MAERSRPGEDGGAAGLPARLRMPPRFAVYAVGPGEFRIQSAVQNVSVGTLRHPRAFSRMVERARDGFDTAALLAGLDAGERGEVEQVLRLLLGKAALMDDSAPPAGGAEDAARYERQRIFFSHFEGAPPAGEPAAAAAPAPGDGREGQRRLSAATVTVLGLGRAGSNTARALALAGVGRLRLADARPVAADDVWGGGFFDDGDVGRPRAEALAARIRRCNGDVQAQAVPWSGGEPAEQVRPLVEGSTLAVLCPDDFHPRDYDAVNEACIAAGVTWINRRALGFDVTVGPMVIPGESPCYRCFELRSLGNLMDPAERMKLHAHLDHAALESGALPVAAGVEILVTECLKRLSGIGPPSTVGSVVFLSPTSVDVRRRPLLKIPRCPACGHGARDRPRMDPWAHFLE